MNLSEIWVRSYKETNFSHYSALDSDWKGSIENLPKFEACKCDACFFSDIVCIRLMLQECFYDSM